MEALICSFYVPHVLVVNLKNYVHEMFHRRCRKLRLVFHNLEVYTCETFIPKHCDNLANAPSIETLRVMWPRSTSEMSDSSKALTVVLIGHGASGTSNASGGSSVALATALSIFGYSRSASTSGSCWHC